MLTRRANRVRGLREAALALPLLGPLPGDLVKLILRLLPLDGRLCAREVRRGWCALLEDASFWTHVDLSASCGVNPRFLSDSRLALALLGAACARAKGNLQSMDLSGVAACSYPDLFVMQWLDSVSVANKASLRDLVAPTTHCLGPAQVVALCSALPLCRVRCGVYCGAVKALPLLRREPPFALLSINTLAVKRGVGGDQIILDLASALMGHKGMEQLNISGVLLDTRATVDALVDAAISAGIKKVSFIVCGLSQTALPALTRLLQSPGFERLEVYNDGRTLFEGPTLPAFCEALRNSTSLKILRLSDLWADVETATQLIAALEVLPALQELVIGGSPTDGTVATQRAAGECLARLIARNRSLRALILRNDRLGEAGLGPIFEALRGDSGLAELSLYEEQISAEFARNVVLPAVRASASLRTLSTGSVGVEPPPAMRELEDILEARRRADKKAT